MAITVNEIASEKSKSTDTQYVRTFRVIDTAAPTTTLPAPDSALSAPGVPEEFDAHPQNPRYIAEEYSIRKIPAENGWDVEWRYNLVPITPQNPDDSDTPTDPGDVGFLDFSLTARTQFQEFWRDPTPDGTVPGLTGVTFPSGQGVKTPGPVPLVSNLRVDIGGTPIDTNGEPMSVEVTVGAVQVTQNIGELPDPAFFFSFLGRRNTKDIFNLKTGSLYYSEIRTTRLSLNIYQVTHTFLYDELFHLRQAAVLRDDRSPHIGNLTVDSTTYSNVAATVYWVQPFPRMTDFAGLDFEDPYG